VGGFGSGGFDEHVSLIVTLCRRNSVTFNIVTSEPISHTLFDLLNNFLRERMLVRMAIG
jgi:hypothetical protein